MGDAVGNREFVLGVVAPDAPQDCYCLHGLQPCNGVWIRILGFECNFKEGDAMSVRVDMNLRRATFWHNGAECKEPIDDLPSCVIPVVELYVHEFPRVTIL